jgi:hypothetical protein
MPVSCKVCNIQCDVKRAHCPLKGRESKRSVIKWAVVKPQGFVRSNKGHRDICLDYTPMDVLERKMEKVYMPVSKLYDIAKAEQERFGKSRISGIQTMAVTTEITETELEGLDPESFNSFKLEWEVVDPIAFEKAENMWRIHMWHIDAFIKNLNQVYCKPKDRKGLWILIVKSKKLKAKVVAYGASMGFQLKWQ